MTTLVTDVYQEIWVNHIFDYLSIMDIISLHKAIPSLYNNKYINDTIDRIIRIRLTSIVNGNGCTYYFNQYINDVRSLFKNNILVTQIIDNNIINLDDNVIEIFKSKMDKINEIKKKYDVKLVDEILSKCSLYNHYILFDDLPLMVHHPVGKFDNYKPLNGVAGIKYKNNINFVYLNTTNDVYSFDKVKSMIESYTPERLLSPESKAAMANLHNVKKDYKISDQYKMMQWLIELYHFITHKNISNDYEVYNQIIEEQKTCESEGSESENETDIDIQTRHKVTIYDYIFGQNEDRYTDSEQQVMIESKTYNNIVKHKFKLCSYWITFTFNQTIVYGTSLYDVYLRNRLSGMIYEPKSKTLHLKKIIQSNINIPTLPIFDHTNKYDLLRLYNLFTELFKLLDHNNYLNSTVDLLSFIDNEINKTYINYCDSFTVYGYNMNYIFEDSDDNLYNIVIKNPYKLLSLEKNNVSNGLLKTVKKIYELLGINNDFSKHFNDRNKDITVIPLENIYRLVESKNKLDIYRFYVDLYIIVSVFIKSLCIKDKSIYYVINKKSLIDKYDYKY